MNISILSKEKIINFVRASRNNFVRFQGVLSLEIRRKITMVNFVSHVESTVKFKLLFFFDKFVRFRVKD